MVQIAKGASRGEFKDLILDNFFVVSKAAAQLFDNLYRANTNHFSWYLGCCFEHLLKKLDREDALSVPGHLWDCYMLLWQSANTLIAAHQNMRVGCPIEAMVVARHAFELHAVALTLFHKPETFKDFENDQLKSTACVKFAKTIFPDFGIHYGVLSDLAHPRSKHVGTYLHPEPNGKFTLLIGTGIPDSEPRLVRGALIKGLVLFIELQASILHASCELVSLDEVTELEYWKRTSTGAQWSPSKEISQRFKERGDKLLQVMSEISG